MLDSLLKPPRELLERAARYFLDGSAILFNYFSEDELQTLFDQAYSPTECVLSRIALCQLSATAATGCQYYPELFDEDTRKAFLAIVRVTLDDCLEAAPLCGMRVMALLCMYFTFEKRNAALAYAEMGLRIARVHRLNHLSGEAESPCWRRTVNSLVFMNCWVSATTGHLPESILPDQSHAVHFDFHQDTTVDIVQNQMVKLAILTGLILQDVYHARLVTAGTLKMYRGKLEAWLVNLPEFMQPASLLKDSTDNSLRAVFLVHLLYMHTLILLYRRAMVELADVGLRNNQPDVFDKVHDSLEPCVWSARQVGRILRIAHSNHLILRKCWMFINTSYCKCNVLLYFAACRLLSSTHFGHNRPRPRGGENVHGHPGVLPAVRPRR